MNEFGLRGGSVTKGIVSAIAGTVEYAVIPLIVLITASSLLTDADGGDVAEQIGLHDVLGNVLILSIPIIVLSFLKGYYPRGSYSRATAGVAAAALIGLWIWTVTMGGKLDLQFEEIGLTVDFSGFVYLFLLMAALKGAYSMVEMLSYRREWLGTQGASRPLEGEASSP